MLTCVQCGQERREGDAFCPKCGRQYEEFPATPVDEMQPDPAVEADQGPPETHPEGEDSGKQAPQWSGESVPRLYCPQCGERVLVQGRFCSSCGARMDGASEELIPVSQPYFSARDEDVAPKPFSRRRNKGIVLGILGALVVVLSLSIVLVVQMLPQRGKVVPADTEMSIVYVQDGSRLKFKNSSMHSAETVTSAFDVQTESDWDRRYLALTSGNGRYLLYLNDYRNRDNTGGGKGDLYIRDIGVITREGQPTDKGTKIASDVTMSFYFSGDDNYVVYIDYNGDLYAWDFSESYRLDSDVTGIYEISDDKILYYKGNDWINYLGGSTEHDVYVSSLKKGSRDSRAKIDTNITGLVDWSEDFTRFMFTKDSSNRSEENLLDLYYYDAEDDSREKLLSDIGQVVSADTETKTAVYLTPRAAALSLEDLIEDDMQSADAAVSEPDLEDYPNITLALEEVFATYDMGWMFGMGNYFDYSDIFFILEEFLEFYEGDSEVDIDALREEMDQLEQALEDYESKNVRDSLREKVREDMEYQLQWQEISLYDLHLYKNGDRRKLDTSLYRANTSTRVAVADLDLGYAAYIKRDFSKLEKMKMSEITDSGYTFSFDIQDYLQKSLPGELYALDISGNAPAMLGREDANSFLSLEAVDFVEDGSGVYFLMEKSGYAANGGNLYYAPMGESIGDAKLVDENVNLFLSYQGFKGKCLYMKNYKNGKGDLYAVSGADKERLCYDISVDNQPTVWDEGETLLFFENLDTGTRTGDLYAMGRDKVKVAGDVFSYFYRTDSLIYLWRDYRAGKGDLYVYDGEGLSLVDYDVTNIFGY